LPPWPRRAASRTRSWRAPKKIAQETRDADIAATRAELERLRSKATEEIEGEKQKALQELRSEVADLALAAAGKVVGESMNDARQRKLVEEFLRIDPGRGREELITEIDLAQASAAQGRAEHPSERTPTCVSEGAQARTQRRAASARPR